MKSLFLLSLAVFAAVATTADATNNGLRITIHHAKEEEPAPKHAVTNHSNNKRFAKFAHLKATPWDAQPQVKASKCEDLCFLQGFYTFQKDRNCDFRPTGLCMQYKLGQIGLEAVLATAECTCDADGSGSKDDDETVEVTAPAHL